MKKIVFAIALFSLLVTFTPETKAAIINFDDLPSSASDVIPANYEGFDWTNFYYVDPTLYGPPDVSNGAVSKPHAAFNGYGISSSLSRNTNFNFNSGWFTAWAWNDFSLKLSAFNAGNLVGSSVLNLSLNNPTFYNLNFENIDTLVFEPDSPSPSWFVMDDITVDNPVPVPEPSSIILGLLGLTGALSLKKRQKIA